MSYSKGELLKFKERLNRFHQHIVENSRANNPEIAHLIHAPLHEGQVPIAQALFVDNCLEIKAQCGRNFGKSESALYCAWRWGAFKKNQIIYILCPERKQAREIYWESGRLQSYGPRDFIMNVKETHLRIVLDTGSFIAIDGSDNYESLRGVKPHLVIYDEDQHHDPRVDIAMRPNLAAKKAPLLRLGTPPDAECYCTEIREDILKQISKGSKKHFYIERPTWENPYIDKEWIQNERERLYARGDGAVFEREYGAKFIPGGARAVFPNFQKRKDQIVKPPSIIRSILKRDAKNFKHYAIADPGQSCFAVLFFAHNPYSAQIVVYGEIYERDREQTAVGKIYPRMRRLEAGFTDPEKVTEGCDEAASWFRAEVYNQFHRRGSNAGIVVPVKKRRGGMEEEISLTKDIFDKENALLVSEDCKMFIWEFDNYVTDDNGKYPDKNDHLIDDWRYGLNLCGFVLPEGADYDEYSHRFGLKKNRPETLQELMTRARLNNDPFEVAEGMGDFEEGHYLEESYADDEY